MLQFLGGDLTTGINIKECIDEKYYEFIIPISVLMVYGDYRAFGEFGNHNGGMRSSGESYFWGN